MDLLGLHCALKLPRSSLFLSLHLLFSLPLQVLRQLQQGLAKCYSVAFEKSGAVSDAKITPHTLNFVKKLVSTFGVGLENVSNVSTMFSSAASESLARRAQATAQDPVFQKMKGQFTTGAWAFRRTPEEREDELCRASLQTIVSCVWLFELPCLFTLYPWLSAI